MSRNKLEPIQKSTTDALHESDGILEALKDNLECGRYTQAILGYI